MSLEADLIEIKNSLDKLLTMLTPKEPPPPPPPPTIPPLTQDMIDALLKSLIT